MNSTIKQNRVIAHPSEWMVSTSMPELDVRIKENGDTVIFANLSFLPDRSVDPNQSDALVIRRACLDFRGGQWVCTHPPDSDRETISQERFDFSSMPFRAANGSGVISVLADFRTAWIETGLCPDPRVYEIDESDWLKKTGATKFGLKHFVLVGTDLWVEVLAEKLVADLTDYK